MPTAVLFDLYNTLVDGGDRGASALHAGLAADLGVDAGVLGIALYRCVRRCRGDDAGRRVTGRRAADRCRRTPRVRPAVGVPTTAIVAAAGNACDAGRVAGGGLADRGCFELHARDRIAVDVDAAGTALRRHRVLG